MEPKQQATAHEWCVGALDAKTQSVKQEVLLAKIIDLATIHAASTQLTTQVAELTAKLTQLQNNNKKSWENFHKVLGELAQANLLDLGKVYLVDGKGLVFYKNRFNHVEVKVYETCIVR